MKLPKTVIRELDLAKAEIVAVDSDEQRHVAVRMLADYDARRLVSRGQRAAVGREKPQGPQLPRSRQLHPARIPQRLESVDGRVLGGRIM